MIDHIFAMIIVSAVFYLALYRRPPDDEDVTQDCWHDGYKWKK